MRALELQARTRSELAKLLAKRGIPDDVAEEVLDRFVEVGLINDAAFAEAWVQDRQQRRHLSARALESELYRKGVGKDEIREAVGAVSAEDEYEAALEFAQGRASRMQGIDPVARRRRLAGQLARRGFSSSVVSRVLAEVLSAIDDDQWGA